ncbi:cell division protein PerM [Motilibacter deserti]|uniref:Integral membrane protein n=1 Tax=Motilibacter deserti TaxID=2714956 RepID=A0ABX0H2J0_9ACTN|nr:DUF6350 family protein [Motilibacter deserti]NHC15947.1 hypothetical protein [Motilibacter deserti]
MATLLPPTRTTFPRPSAARPPRPRSTRAMAGAAAAGAARGAGFSLLTCAVVVLVGWAGAHGTGAGAVDAVRTTAYAWLLAHHIDLTLSAGSLRLAPLGLIVLPFATLAAAGYRAARSAGVRTGREAGVLTASGAVAYAVLTLVVALASRSEHVQPSVPGAMIGGLLMGAAGTGLGALRALRRRSALPVMPLRPGTVLAASVGAVLTLLGTGALLLAGSLVAHLDRGADLAASLEPGPLGGFLLLLLGVGLVPNAVVCATAYAVGPGFAVGAGTSVAPAGVTTGEVPALPLLAALPVDGSAPALSLLAIAAPLAAGVVAGVVAGRRAPADDSPDRAAGTAALAGLVSGVVLAVLGALAGGSAGADRLAAVGPSPLRLGLAVAAEVGLVAAATAWLLVRRAADARTDERAASPVAGTA